MVTNFDMSTDYVIFGHSFGAFVAYEFVKKLEYESRNLPICVFISGQETPEVKERYLNHTFDNEELITILETHYEALPKSILDDDFLLNTALNILRADLKILDCYMLKAPIQISVPIHLLFSDRDGTIDKKNILHWENYTHNEFAKTIFEGNHFFCYKTDNIKK